MQDSGQESGEELGLTSPPHLLTSSPPQDSGQESGEELTQPVQDYVPTPIGEERG